MHLVYIRLCLASLKNFDRSNEYIALIGYNYVTYVAESPWAGRHWSARSYEDCSPWTKTTRSTTLHPTSTQGQQGSAQISKRTVNIPGTTTPTLQTYFQPGPWLDLTNVATQWSQLLPCMLIPCTKKGRGHVLQLSQVAGMRTPATVSLSMLSKG